MDLFLERRGLSKTKVKMPYGKYNPAELVFAELWGREVLVQVPDRYSGLLWAKIYDPQGEEIPIAETYFEKLATKHEKVKDEYTELIRTVIHNYCTNYVKPFCVDSTYHACQSGFGQENLNGLIDFTTVQPIRAPNTLFGIKNELYTIKWEYSPGDPHHDEGEKYEYE